jgi:hypothetical protein
MALSDVTETINDGALGLVADVTDSVCVKIGYSTLGPTNTLVAFNDKASLVNTFGAGPMVDAAALSLDVAGGPVMCLKPTMGVDGSVTAVVHTGAQGALPTVSGSPLDSFDVKVTVTRAAIGLAANTAAFTYTLDGGDNVSAEIAVPLNGAYPIPNSGLTLTFADGTFVPGDAFAFKTTPPSFTLTNLSTAIAALLLDPRTWGFLHIVGPAASASAAASLVASLDTLLSGAAQVFRYAFAVIEAPDASDADLIAALKNAASRRVMVCAGFAEVVSPVSGLIQKRSVAFPVAARIAQVPIHEDLGRVRSGPVAGVANIYRDEQATPVLDSQRMATLRTIIGQQGFWVTAGRLIAPAGSDFQHVQFRRVMDRACSTARDALVKYLNDSLRLDPVTGLIRESEARSIEADVGGKLNDALVANGHASAVSIHIDRTANISSTQTMPVTIRVLPLGYARFITVDIGFKNPALEPTP